MCHLLGVFFSEKLTKGDYSKNKDARVMDPVNLRGGILISDYWEIILVISSCSNKM